VPGVPVIAILDDPSFDRHRSPGGRHPECPERLDAARAGVAAALDGHPVLSVGARAASLSELAAVHDPTHLARLARTVGEGAGQVDADTFFGPGTWEAATRAAGGAVALMDGLLSGQAQRGMALVRPPGHHATPDAAMGFCLLNNIAVAAAAARARGVERVAIVDWDVHHGNGTQAAFEADPSVAFFSLHQWPLYPGTGAATELGRGPGHGLTRNVPLPPGTGPEGYGAALRELVLPTLRAFQPGLLLISAGFDADRRDPLAEMALDPATFGGMTRALLDALDPEVPVALFLEGGYDLTAVEEDARAVVDALAGAVTALPDAAPRPAERRAIADVAKAWAAAPTPRGGKG